jgi:hypothetical protein
VSAEFSLSNAAQPGNRILLSVLGASDWNSSHTDHIILPRATKRAMAPFIRRVYSAEATAKSGN